MKKILSIIKILLKKQFHLFCKASLIFCSVSFLSTILCLVTRNDIDFPVTNIGFPLKYYYQFWDSQMQLHWGWSFFNAIVDFVLIYFIVFFLRYEKYKAQNR